MSEEPPIQSRSVWQHYRRTFVITQLFILSMLIALWYFARLPWQTLLVFLVSLQFFAFFGAWWGANLARRIASKDTERDKELPLRRKLKK